MTPKLVDAALERIQYKPGYILCHRWRTDSVIEVWWSYARPDAFDPSQIEQGTSGAVLIWVPDVDSTETLVRTVFGMTMRLEEHEAREFFQFDGQRPFNPHKQLLDPQ